MVVVSGVRTTQNIEQARRVVDMAKEIALLDPNESPFVTFLKVAKRGTRVAYNPKFEWLEDDLLQITATSQRQSPARPQLRWSLTTAVCSKPETC